VRLIATAQRNRVVAYGYIRIRGITDTRGTQLSAERERVATFGDLAEGLRGASDWYLWGPYLTERQWGTVREDYSPDGDAWNYLTHDQARSRAYRWGEEGMAGFCDVEQRLCLSLALWNGRDPMLKERMFGLTGPEGNHGEDAKDYWWYLDAIPSHAWNRWRYHYPQREFPYQDLRTTNQQRDRTQPEYELLDTGVFDENRYWITEVSYAKADPGDILMRITVTNAGPEQDTIHVLPTTWFRNTWAWDDRQDAKPELRQDGTSRIAIGHPFLGDLELVASPAPDGAEPYMLFCENETGRKDGINDHVVCNAATVNEQQKGTKAAFWYKISLGPGESAEVRLRLRPRGHQEQDFDAVLARREAEADEFYAELAPKAASQDERSIMRQAFAGMLWCKQLYYFDVSRWLDGDPGQPPPPQQRKQARNSKWRTFDAFDIMSMPDSWEYPWFAAWDMSFHCVTLAHIDPAFAKYQLELLSREWFQHPSGSLPAYEWDFGDVNPPVRAWAALEVWAIDGGRDPDFLARVFHKLLITFTWWVNREDANGNNLFEGGFLGLDNIGPIDRSHLPCGGVLEQSDATGWMAFFAVSMGRIARVLYRAGKLPGTDLMIKFLEHFAQISEAIAGQGMWDDEDGMYYDVLVTPSGARVPVKARSMVGMIPMFAVTVIEQPTLSRSLTLGKRFARSLNRQGHTDADTLRKLGVLRGEPGAERLLLSVVGTDRFEKMLARLFDPEEFLSPHGLRALSRYHQDHPYQLNVEGVCATVDYEPAESTIPMFGGNSNWRGPVWFPLNYLLISCLESYHRFFGDEFTVEYPSGSGQQRHLDDIAQDLRDRLIGIFRSGEDGRRPCFGGIERFQTDPAWHDNIVFSEYFHGDNGAGIGASHQTGWTGLVADLILRRYNAVPAVDDMIEGTRYDGDA
jgi:hypothetical protein